MKKIKFISVICDLLRLGGLLLVIGTANSQWIQQNSGVTTPLYNVEFVNQYTGWATGNSSVILKTTNGGVNWFQQTINLGYPKNLYGLDMLDANTGYIAGWFETILKTTNGGSNWIIISNIPSNDGNSNSGVSFINSQTGWVCSSLGRTMRTTNGGLSWDTAYVGTGGPLRDIQFLNSQTGWVCGDVGLLKKSTNSGINWSVSVLPTTSNLTGLHFLNINTGWVVSEQQNEVFRTTNGGNKWDTVAILPGGSLQYSYSIYFSSSLTGYIGGTFGRLFKSTNGGLNWAQQNVTYSMFVCNFSFINDSTGWCVGGGGGILHTNNGGTYVTIKALSNDIPQAYKLHQNYPNPFNSTTLINFDIYQTSDILITLNDILGRTTKIIINKKLESGVYQIKLTSQDLSSGIYFYSMIVNGNHIDSKKLIIIK